MQNTFPALDLSLRLPAFYGALRHVRSAYISAGWRSLEAYRDVYIHERILGVKVLSFQYSSMRDDRFSTTEKKNVDRSQR